MKIIEAGQKYLAMLGICSNQSLKNVKFLSAIFFNIENVSGNLAFLFYEASTFYEYANSTFLASTIIMAAICFVIVASNKSIIFPTIDLGNDLVEKSEQNHFAR